MYYVKGIYARQLTMTTREDKSTEKNKKFELVSSGKSQGSTSHAKLQNKASGESLKRAFKM